MSTHTSDTSTAPSPLDPLTHSPPAYDMCPPSPLLAVVDSPPTNGHTADSTSNPTTSAAVDAVLSSLTSDTNGAGPSPPLKTSPTSTSTASASSSGMTSQYPPSRPTLPPSRQRSAVTLPPPLPPSTSITIDSSDAKHPSPPSRKPRAKPPPKRRGWCRLDRLIGCVMVLCFLGSLVLYLILSLQPGWVNGFKANS